MTTNEILKQLRQEKKITQAQAADDLGVSLSSYQKYEREKNYITPSVDVLCKLADYYNTTVDYLLGRAVPPPPTLEEMLEHYDLSDTERKFFALYVKIERRYRESLVEAIETAAQKPDSRCVVVYLPVSEAKVSAGTGVYVADYNTWEKLPFIDTGAHDLDGCYVLCIKGDSMEPKFFDGDHIIVNPEQIPEEGEIGIFVIGDEGFVKMLGHGCLRSLNKKYDDIPITEDTRSCGKVLGTIAPAE